MTKQAVVTGGAGSLDSQLDVRLLPEDIEAVCLDEPLTGAAGFEADGRVVLRAPPSSRTLNCRRDVSIIWATRV
jgi:hypothetical protein